MSDYPSCLPCPVCKVKPKGKTIKTFVPCFENEQKRFKISCGRHLKVISNTVYNAIRRWNFAVKLKKSKS